MIAGMSGTAMPLEKMVYSWSSCGCDRGPILFT